jgi:hypothetical protein
MPRMLHESFSTEKHLNACWRHIRLSGRVQGADKYVVAIKPRFDSLEAARQVTVSKIRAREAAYDDLRMTDTDVDNMVRTAYARCEQFDRENTGRPVLPLVFPLQRYSDITKAPIMKEPDLVEELAIRMEKLGESHTLNGLSAILRQKVGEFRAAIEAFYAAIREQKTAEAEEEIAQEQLRRQYEINYLESRKDLGKATAETLFPDLGGTQTIASEPETQPVTA